MDAMIQNVPSMAGPVPTIFGLYYVTAGWGNTQVGSHFLTLDDAEALARWAVNSGQVRVTIRRSEDWSMTVPFSGEGRSAWPAAGKQYCIRDGRIVAANA